MEQALRSVVSVLPEWPPDVRRTEEPEGSGVAVLDGRHILTAAHIVNKALSVRVRTSQGEIVAAEIKGRDLATDLALLTVVAPLPAIEIAGEAPALGDKVCAIGNAFGLGLSVTCGVVSGLHRSGVGFNRIEDFVQTDAAVNPGASGGALVGADGKLVGVLSAIFTKRSDANVGVNFAVSSDLALRVARALHEEGRVRRAVSGLALEPFPSGNATGRQGARVKAVRPGSLGERAGVRIGDVIVKAGGRRIRKPADFASAMAGLTAQGLRIVFIREGQRAEARLVP